MVFDIFFAPSSNFVLSLSLSLCGFSLRSPTPLPPT